VVLTVENTGEKLTPQLAATLAEPFLRGTKRRRTDHAGVGLGLAIVKGITQAHDGTLTLAPRAAGGLRVTVQLPAAPPQPRDVCQRANGLGTGPGDRYRVPQCRPGHLEEEVDKSPEGA
jgi:K+-sensing histidine kinase KdpD